MRASQQELNAHRTNLVLLIKVEIAGMIFFTFHVENESVWPYSVGTTISLTSMFPMMNGKKAKASPVRTIMGKAM